MEKKFYEIPEIELLDLEIEAPILTISVGDDDEPKIISGEGDVDDLG